jgi:hypothetical protein
MYIVYQGTEVVVICTQASDAAAYKNVTTRKDQAPYKIVKQTG